MDPNRDAQYPIDMGDRRSREITVIFQYITQNTMFMGSTPGGSGTMLVVLSNFTTHPNPEGAPMTKSTTLKSAALAFALVLAGIAHASAAEGPTMQEKMACKADAETFCSQFVGKAPQMRACLEIGRASCRERV